MNNTACCICFYEGDSTMSQSEKIDEAHLSSNDKLSEDHDNQKRQKRFEQKNRSSTTPSAVSIQSNKSMDYPLVFKHGSFSGVHQDLSTCHQTNADSLFGVLEKDTITFVKSELKKLQRLLSSDSSKDFQSQLEEEEEFLCDAQEKRSREEAFLKIILQFLRLMNEEEIADALLNSDSIVSPSEEKDEDYLPSNDKTSEKCDNWNRSERIQLKRHKFVPPSSVSLKSDKSMDYPLGLKQAEETSEEPAAPNFVSFRSNKSMDYPLGFKQAEKKNGTSTPNFVPLQSNKSMDYPLGFKQEGKEFRAHQKANLDSVFKLLEEKIVAFVKNELKKFQKLLNLERVCNQNEEEQVVDCKEEEEKMISKEAFLTIILQFLRRMNQEELGSSIMNKTCVIMCHCKLKFNLKKRLAYVFEGMAKAENPTLLKKIYTELYIIEGNTTQVNRKHEVKLIERVFMKSARPEKTIRCEDIFKSFSRSDKPIRTVMTEGVAGIGKTVLTQKFALDWAEDKANQNIQFIFPFSFRELNMVKQEKFSLVGLIHLFFSESKEAGIRNFEEFQVLFIFDGLDECRFPLNLNSKEILTDVTKPTSLDVLLTNLIRGKLLPSARIWITTRPAAACQIPPEFVDLVTDVRGFNDPQKEEYFRKRFTEEEQTRAIISHIKASRSLHIMCHIPVFCWISATVLEDAFKAREKRELPTSLTEMYVYFLVVLSKVKKVKYDGGAETDSLWSPETRKMIQSLGKLAFEQLMEGNLFFYESDLTECGIEIKAASVYSGVFTEIFQEERGVFHEKVFCFVHLSVQEFLAALHVHLTFISTGVNLLSEEQSSPQKPKISAETFDLFYQRAVDKALQSRNGHLDLFLRFLLGLSLRKNQTLLHGLVTRRETEISSSQNTVQYIKKKISQNVCILKNNNLFYCLNELKDCSLIEEVQQTLRSGRLPTDKLPPAQWAALVNVILSSEGNLDEFDLKNYYESDVALVGLVTVVINCTKAVLSCCNLTEMCCSGLASSLQSKCFILKKLDLSNNDLKDSGVKLLCGGLRSPNCTLETLRLSGCLITKEGCVALSSSLSFNCSHLKELDLSYNHPEEFGIKLFSAGLEDPSWALQTLRTEPGGPQFLKPGLGKYACELILDSNTAHRDLALPDNRKVTVRTENHPYPDHPERFEVMKQLLCKDGLTGQSYWEVEWRGSVCIAVTYKGIRRKGGSNDSCLGMNAQSWCLLCSDDGHSVLHDNQITPIQGAPSNRVGVYLDWPDGSLSFFRLFSDKKIHLHTFNFTFTEPVYPGFGIVSDSCNSSLALCHI
ncbi:NACHT, LRR and PYD domains-containing protein 12-like isoform X1 [Kryptolebias marmoratus]|uniref:NACHT, LRR and PYD domains-containing protein 12-like isoform X1 n=2 Tax=Kryptolebias marmoratus TaxID=37003 RepID=UPI0018ACF493|nr:NACHT, LRR and PYD domains-containing protein 12-like isoform X1 [Kryptolebias marmoratus]